LSGHISSRQLPVLTKKRLRLQIFGIPVSYQARKKELHKAEERRKNTFYSTVRCKIPENIQTVNGDAISTSDFVMNLFPLC
jgi:hypothetical protein